MQSPHALPLHHRITRPRLRQIVAAAAQAVPLLLKIAAMDPAFTKGTATAQVSAGKEIVDTAEKALEAAAGTK